MKQIPLTQGKYAIVDDEDFEYLNQWKWRVGTSGYATRTVQGKNDLGARVSRSLIMHRVIMNAKKGEFIDHVDTDRLNNRKNNLRFCSSSQNSMNRSKKSKSKFKGVSWHKRDKRWRAEIKVDGIRIHLGYYVNAIEAVSAYDQAAKKYFGEFAKTNNL